MKIVLFVLDCSFDMEAELTPLESAINVLEMIKTEFTLTEAVVESSRKLVKEAVRLYFKFFFLLPKIRGLCGICLSFLCGVEDKQGWRESK